MEKLKRNRLEAWNHMRARIARKNLNEQIKMYTAFIEGEGQVNSDMKMEYAVSCCSWRGGNCEN